MGDERLFFRDAAQWNAIADRLKQTPCPHCKRVGALIQHGFLYGFDDTSPRRKTVRARRVFCSNRQARPGCGRTFSVWCADKIRRLSLTTSCLWRFLLLAVTGSLHTAIRAVHGHLGERSWLRIWKRFNLGQSKIRTALSALCPPPQLTAQAPMTDVLAHLGAAFPDADCPIAAFQHALRTFFL